MKTENIKKYFDTDNKKGTAFFIASLIGYGLISFITKKSFSFLYGIPGTLLVLALVFWYFEPKQRIIGKGYGVILSVILCLWILLVIMELTLLK